MGSSLSCRPSSCLPARGAPGVPQNPSPATREGAGPSGGVAWGPVGKMPQQEPVTPTRPGDKGTPTFPESTSSHAWGPSPERRAQRVKT